MLVSRRFHGPVYFKKDFGANFEYHLNSTNQSAKPTDLKIIIFCLVIKFSFPFDILYFECAHIHGGDSISEGKSALKCV